MSAAEAPQPERCPRLVPGGDGDYWTCAHLRPCPYHDGPDGDPVFHIVQPVEDSP